MGERRWRRRLRLCSDQMDMIDFENRWEMVFAKLYPSWHKHRWNDETKAELFELLQSFQTEESIACLRCYFKDHNTFSHPEFVSTVRRYFRSNVDKSKWTPVDEHHLRLLVDKYRNKWSELDDAAFEAKCYQIIGKNPTALERKEAVEILNRHVREANQRFAERGSSQRYIEYPSILVAF